jgi:hypothetical protein
MPTRKQKRRRDKLMRHEYEYVIETETGEEVPVESPREVERARAGGDTRKTTAKGPVDRRGRPLTPPSWRRVFRRAAVFAPLMAVFVYITSKDQTDNIVAVVVFQTTLLLAFFLPFSYMVDVFMYRLMTRRLDRERADKRPERR